MNSSNMKRRVVVTGGGSGGHISAAIAVVELLRQFEFSGSGSDSMGWQ